jgi:hypothetical protein
MCWLDQQWKAVSTLKNHQLKASVCMVSTLCHSNNTCMAKTTTNVKTVTLSTSTDRQRTTASDRETPEGLLSFPTCHSAPHKLETQHAYHTQDKLWAQPCIAT